MEFKEILYAVDRETGIARVTINRPQFRNALNTAVRRELREAIRLIDLDPEVRVVILTGAGDKAFISGADVNEFKEADPIMVREFASKIGQQLFTDLENLRVPVIGMINGFCLGAGLEVALCCDIRIASGSARFGSPEVNLGIFPGGGATQRLPRLVGWGRAKEMIYTGRIIDAAEAERIGIADRVVPPEKLEEEVGQLARQIAGKSPLIIQLAKEAINRGMYSDLAAGLCQEKANFALCFATGEPHEGISAFLEKRPPRFKGR